MKLYATVTSERNSRPAKKGGDEWLHIKLTDGNREMGIIRFSNGKLTYDPSNVGEKNPDRKTNILIDQFLN